MARNSSRADSQVNPTLRCRTRDPGLGLCAVLAIAVLLFSACRDDDGVTGPSSIDTVPTSKIRSFESNGGQIPEVITGIVGDTEVHLFTFTVDTLYQGQFDIDGAPWGVWFGNGELPFTEDPPTGNVAWYSRLVYGGAASPPHNATQFSYPQSFLYFYPPVRSVSFLYASDVGDGNGSSEDAFYYRASDTLGSTIEFDSIRANQEPPGSTMTVPPDDWDLHTIAEPNGEDRIYEIFFNGRMRIDDMEIVRAAPPAIVCDTVIRGSLATCSVRPEVLATLDAVTNWSFEAVFEHNGKVQMIDGPDADSTWSGVAVTGGTAHAWGHTSSDSLPLHGELVVAPRSGPDWKWPAPDSAFQWADQPNGGMQGCSYGFSQPIAQNNGAISFLAGVNARRTSCDPGIIDPSIHTNPTGGFTTDSISDQGPNNGLVYVASAEYFLDRGSVINPWLLEQGPGSPVDTITKKDSKDCPSQWRTGPQDRAVVNTYTYNVECKQRSLAALHAGIHRHEGNGSGQLNGHRAQRLRFVHDEGNVPHAGVEAVVDSTSGFLLIGIGRVLDDVEDGLHQAADPAHILVHGNWQEDFYIQSSNGHFHDRTMNDGN